MELSTLGSDLTTALPVFVLITWAILQLMLDLFIERKSLTAGISLMGLLVTGGLLAFQAVNTQGLALTGFNDMLVLDGFSLFLQAVIVMTAFLSVLIAMEYLPRHNLDRGEFYTLLLFTTAGMMLMTLANDLIVVFVALEMLSIPLYILSGFARPQIASEEAAMKYFLLGAFASGFMVYGIALAYGGTGTTNIPEIVAAFTEQTLNSEALALIGMGLIIVGLGFKVATVPFHQWTPDVYQGAPTPVTAFMSVGAKVGGFAALLRVLILAFPTLSGEWGTVAAVIAGLTMILGNVVAISQTDIKRMLAYSSIAHAGYLMMAVAAAQVDSVADIAASAAAFYLLTYAFTNLGAFAVVQAVEHEKLKAPEIADFAGLSKTHPWLSAAMTLFMLSLAGLPPSAGLVGKFFVFQAAIQGAAEAGDGFTSVMMVVLAIIGVLTSLVSAFYYARIIIMMYFRDGAGEAEVRPALGTATALTALATLVLGIIPGPIFFFAQQALLKFGG